MFHFPFSFVFADFRNAFLDGRGGNAEGNATYVTWLAGSEGVRTQGIGDSGKSADKCGIKVNKSE